jgi:tetratricopeptide (TPR) repeat protein
VCVKTTKIVITPRPKVYERRTVIRRPVIEREVVYTPRESAWSLLADWRFQRALEAFGDRASRDRRSGEHKVGYALAAYGLGETKLAATAFRRALELDPQVMTAFVPSRRLERLVLELEGRLDRAVRHDPYDTDAVFTLSSVRTLLGHVRSGSDLDHEDLAMLRDTDRELLERALGAEEDDPYRE